MNGALYYSLFILQRTMEDVLEAGHKWALVYNHALAFFQSIHPIHRVVATVSWRLKPNSNSLVCLSNMLNILDLANELQLEIFQLCILEPEDDLPDVRFTLAAVCGHWRDLIFNVASLWTSITVDSASVIPHPLYRHDDCLLYPEDVFLRTMVAFKNARGLPVDLTIEVPDAPIPCFNVRHTNLLAEILCDEASRIASLSISGDCWDMHLSALRGFLNQPMPLLHTFKHSIWECHGVSLQFTFGELTNQSKKRISILQYPFKDSDVAKVNAWGRSMYPSLENVYISGAPYKWHKLPTCGLRTLGMCNQPVVGCPSYPVIRELLSSSASTLETLDLSGVLCFLADENDFGFEPAVLPSLKTLTLSYQMPDEVSVFLPSIRTPALNQLKVAETYSFFLAEDANDTLFATDAMLGAMMQYLPLHQIEVLELDGILFEDTIPTPTIEDCLIEGKVAPKDIPCTMRFLGALTSLKCLDLWSATDSLLSYLNYPVRPSYSKDGQELIDEARKNPGRHFPYLSSLDRLFVHGDDEKIYCLLADRAQCTFREKSLNVVIGETVLEKFDEQRLAELQVFRSELACRSEV